MYLGMFYKTHFSYFLFCLLNYLNFFEFSSHMEHQGSTVVNASATSPEIRLRITDASGQDVQGTKLGEQLQLRIELKNEDSALDMQATHLMAMSGHTQQQIALIDHNGCPTGNLLLINY